PGLIDTHVHFSQTGWVDGRPDALDLRDRYPYELVEAELHARPERFFRSYLCSGVTSVFDVGGYPWTLELQERTSRSTTSPRVRAAGSLLSTIDFWLNLPDQRQFIYMADEAVVRQAVRAHKTWGAAAIKVWYIMPPQPPDAARASDSPWPVWIPRPAPRRSRRIPWLRRGAPAPPLLRSAPPEPRGLSPRRRRTSNGSTMPAFPWRSAPMPATRSRSTGR